MRSLRLVGFNPLARLRQRMGAVLAVLAGTAACCGCGLVLTFILAPSQALQAYRVSRLPVLTAAEIESAAPGAAVLVTGVLAGNAPLLEDPPLVAYAEETWIVTESTTEDGDVNAFGRWQSQPARVPPLNLEVGGQVVPILAASGARLSGPLHEALVPGDGAAEAAGPDGQLLPADSRRYRGLQDGDLTTVLGQRDAAGGVTPQHLFAGDRAAFAASQRQAASGLWFSGLAAIGVSPVILIGGLLAALFWRQR